MELSLRGKFQHLIENMQQGSDAVFKVKVDLGECTSTL